MHMNVFYYIYGDTQQYGAGEDMWLIILPWQLGRHGFHIVAEDAGLNDLVL